MYQSKLYDYVIQNEDAEYSQSENYLYSVNKQKQLTTDFENYFSDKVSAFNVTSQNEFNDLVDKTQSKYILEIEKKYKSEIDGLINFQKSLQPRSQEEADKYNTIIQNRRLDILNRMEVEMQKALEEDPDIQAYQANKRKEFDAFAEIEFSKYTKEWGSNNKRWDEAELIEIGNNLDKLGFENVQAHEKKMMLEMELDRRLEIMERSDPSPFDGVDGDTYRDEYIKEFYAYFYSKLNEKGTGEFDPTTGDEITEPTQFFLKGLGNEMLTFVNENFPKIEVVDTGLLTGTQEKIVGDSDVLSEIKKKAKEDGYTGAQLDRIILERYRASDEYQQAF
jgi:hypothetical protein